MIGLPYSGCQSERMAAGSFALETETETGRKIQTIIGETEIQTEDRCALEADAEPEAITLGHLGVEDRAHIFCHRPDLIEERQPQALDPDVLRDGRWFQFLRPLRLRFRAGYHSPMI